MKCWNLVLALFALPLACQQSDRGGYDAKHTPGDFIGTAELPYWATLEEADYVKRQVGKTGYYPANHPTTQRMQAWADKVRENMIQSSPRLESSPRPLIRILDNNTINAHVAAIKMCADVVIKRRPELQPSLKATPYLTHGNDEYVSSGRPPSCVAFQGNLAAMRDFVQWALRAQKGCNVTISGNDLLVNAACDFGARADSEIFTGLSTSVIHNYVTIYRGLLDNLNEDEAVSVLTHELGHYYMGHPTAVKADYDFFYENGKSHNLGRKPTPLPANHPQADFGARLKALPALGFASVKGQEFHSLVFLLAQKLRGKLPQAPAETSCKSGVDCESSCAPLRDNWRDSYMDTLHYFPGLALKEDVAKKDYVRYESDLKVCFAAHWAAPYRDELNLLMTKLNAFKVLNMQPLNEVSNESVLSFIIRASSAMDEATKALNDTRRKLLDEATQSHLGWYTKEQEADDFSTEMLARIGFDPMVSVTSHLKVGAIALGIDPKCQEYYEQGFPRFISPKDFVNTHHDSCYRAYNAYREIAAHKDFIAQFKAVSEPKVQPELSWKEALDRMKSLPATVP